MEFQLPKSAARLMRHVPPKVNERIRQETSASVARASAKGPDAVRERLERIDREWDLERASELLFAAAALFGLGMATPRRRYWLLLPGLSAGLLALHAVAGRSPTVSLLRRLGFRTPREIEEEREALKSGL